MTSNLIEYNLNILFNFVHNTPEIAIDNIPAHLKMMKEAPHVVVSNLHKFRHPISQPLAQKYRPAFQILTYIAREIPELRDSIVKELGELLFELQSYLTGEAFSLLEETISTCGLPLSDIDKHYTEIARSCIDLNNQLLLVIGAGFSYDAMPITNELEPLLIQTLHNMGIEHPKLLLQNGDRSAWEKIKEDEQRFKDGFSGWCAKQKPAPQHGSVASLLHENRISQIISFNWDDLIERAYSDMFGEAIPKINDDNITPDKPSLWKLHGDVQETLKPWIFPYEEGRIFNSLIPLLEKDLTNKQVEYALIVGYSETEPVICNNLITWLEKNIPKVIRVRPNWDGDDNKGLQAPSKTFFQRLEISFKAGSRS